jgi:hypothetical protein
MRPRAVWRRVSPAKQAPAWDNHADRLATQSPKSYSRGGRWFCFSVRVAQVTRWCSTTSPASWSNATHRMPRVWPKSGECCVGVPEMFVRSQSPEARRSQKKS